MIQKQHCTVHEMKADGTKGDLISEVCIYHTNVLATIATWMMTPVHLAHAWLKTVGAYSQGGVAHGAWRHDLQPWQSDAVNSLCQGELAVVAARPTGKSKYQPRHGMFLMDSTGTLVKVFCRQCACWHAQGESKDSCGLGGKPDVLGYTVAV